MKVLGNDSLDKNLQMHQLEMKHKTLDYYFNKNKTKPINQMFDSFEQGKELLKSKYANYDQLGTYVNTKANCSSKIPVQKLLDFVNKTHPVTTNGKFKMEGIECDVSQIPKIPREKIEPIKAINNVITLSSNKIYGKETSDGEIWGLGLNKNKELQALSSENIYAMEHDQSLKEAHHYANFFSALTATSSTLLLGLEFSYQEVRDMLAELGVEHGFFTIQADQVSQTFYYSNDGMVHPKYEYDGIYDAFKQSYTSDYKVGDEFILDGVSYKIDEEGHLNIPYGGDLFHFTSQPYTKYYKLDGYV